MSSNTNPIKLDLTEPTSPSYNGPDEPGERKRKLETLYDQSTDLDLKQSQARPELDRTMIDEIVSLREDVASLQLQVKMMLEWQIEVMKNIPQLSGQAAKAGEHRQER